MIRYVDSAGWTWEVCELEPQNAAATIAGGTARSGQNVVPDVFSDVEVARRGGVPALADVDVAGRRGELYFFSRLGSRKLRRYPTAWCQLARAELEALCARAEEIA